MVTRNDYSIGRYSRYGLVIEREDRRASRLFVAFPGQDGLPSESRLAEEGRSLTDGDHRDRHLVEYLQVVVFGA